MCVGNISAKPIFIKLYFRYDYIIIPASAIDLYRLLAKQHVTSISIDMQWYGDVVNMSKAGKPPKC